MPFDLRFIWLWAIWISNFVYRISKVFESHYSKHLNTGHFGCLVFKLFSHMTWPTIQIPNILNHKQAFFSPVFRPPFKYQTIWQQDTNIPLEYQTSTVFRWLLYMVKIWDSAEAESIVALFSVQRPKIWSRAKNARHGCCQVGPF